MPSTKALFTSKQYKQALRDNAKRDIATASPFAGADLTANTATPSTDQHIARVARYVSAKASTVERGLYPASLEKPADYQYLAFLARHAVAGIVDCVTLADTYPRGADNVRGAQRCAVNAGGIERLDKFGYLNVAYDHDGKPMLCELTERALASKHIA